MVKRTHRRAKFTFPLAVAAGFASPVLRTIDHAKYGITGPEGAIAEFTRTMIGVNPLQTPMKFELWRLRYGLWPVLLGLGVHKAASALGVNRMLSRAGIPFIRI